MRIVVNHLTRMTAPRICVAGLETETSRHVRPTTPAYDPITRRLLRQEGGAFRVGSVVDLGAVTPDPAPPESEDHRFETNRVRHVEDLAGPDFVGMLEGVAVACLEDGFGTDLERVGWKYAIEAGKGDRSLAVVKARQRPVLKIDDKYGRLQLRFDDPDPRTYLSVTDVRFFEADHATPRQAVVDDVARRLRSGVEAFLMLGLARAYHAPNDDRERHWLQLNGLVLVDRPVGDTP
ncbi:MAG: dual OB domain-containing protein [Solirubrobacteraceae bacterium]